MLILDYALSSEAIAEGVAYHFVRVAGVESELGQDHRNARVPGQLVARQQPHDSIRFVHAVE